MRAVGIENMDLEALLRKFRIEPDPLKDQFFLRDESIIRKIADLAELNHQDVVLEIGAGVGNLTRELSKKSGKVIAFEIDSRFEPILVGLPENVEVHIEDAHQGVRQGGKFRKKKEYNKVVSNLPYSIGEWLLHNLAFVEYDKAILLVAKKFLDSIKTNPVFASFYVPVEKFKVPKDKFYPVPRTDSVVIELARLPDPVDTRDLSLFLRQFMYQREGWKVKNSLREGLITYARLVWDKKLTKRQAREMIGKVGIDEDLLDRLPDNREVYEVVGEGFKDGELESSDANQPEEEEER